MTTYEYGYYNITKLDKEYFTKKFQKAGYKNVHVKRVATDTKGLKMYEITYEK